MSSVESTLFYIGTVAPAARAILAATALLGVAGVVTALAWRASASVRHAIWLLALAAAIAVGIAARVPSVEITSNTVVNGPGVVFDRTFIDPQLPVPLPRVGAPDLTPQAFTESRGIDWPEVRLGELMFALWIIGMFAIIARCVAGHVGIARLIGRSTPLQPELEPIVERFARHVGVTRPFKVLISPEIEAPFTVGARKPVVLLPAESAEWTVERMRIVLVHELAHVARHDYLAQLVATVACAVYWFNPIVWVAATRLRSEAEQAADDRVLSAGVDGVTYASHLLELARLTTAAPRSTAVAVGMARHTRLERRFAAMLDSTRSRGTVALRTQVAGGIAVILLSVPLVGFRMIPKQEKPTTPTLASKTTAGTPTTLGTRTTQGSRTTGGTRTKNGTPTVLGTAMPTRSADSVIDKTLSAAAGERLSINLRTGGSIHVRAWDQNQVRMRARLSGDYPQETTVDFTRVGSGLELRADFARRIDNSRNSNQFELWVPRRFNIEMSSSGGDILLEGVQGTFTGGTGGGEINIENVKGEARITTGGGSVRVANSDLNGSVSTGGGQAVVVATTGNVRVTSGSGPVIRSRDGGSGDRYIGVNGNEVRRTDGTTVIGDTKWNGAVSVSRAGGDIRLDAAPNGGDFKTGGGEVVIGSSSGDLQVSTGGGDVTLDRVGGNATVSTGAGRVQITVVNTDGTQHHIEAHSGTGQIIIELPASIDARFELESGYTERHGKTNIRSDFPVNITETEEWDARNGTPRRFVRATGSAGSGRGLIRIHTVNGDVIIRKK